MIAKEVLRQIVTKQKNELVIKKDSVEREILSEVLKWLVDERIIVITGMRRCGKSTLLKQIMQETSDWCYISFEDERLLGFEAEDFELLNEVLVEVYGTNKTCFFDEIQNIGKFETFVRRLHDEGKKVIITGSNASLLSKEFGTRLTGRYKAFELYPFSFSEFLKFRGITAKKEEWYVIVKKVELLKLFREYVVIGGLPEYLKNHDTEYARTLFENILFRDIIARYSIKREKTMKELINILATSVASKFTYNSLKKTLGLSNAITVKEYISYLGNSYLFFELLKISPSIKKQLASPRKVYLVDSAFHQVCGLTFAPDLGRNLENAVFIELKRRGNEVYYYSDRSECDFLVKDGTKVTGAIQVCYSIDDSNREREISGLIDAMRAFKLSRGLILTFEQTDELMIEGRKIIVMPAPAWIIENEQSF
ncbi:ATP-binding protein [Candidatus Woesearchaeota archaeon]|nr:ATP-binding protein [Candidatus Woesearchaeota archaeon]